MSWFILKSIFYHIIIVFILIYLNQYYVNKDERLIKDNLKLMSSSIRVDVLEMPKYTLKELKLIDLDRHAKTTKKSNSNFKKLMNKFSKAKIDFKTLEKHKQTTKDPFQSRDIKKLIIAGNKISKGASLTGKVSVKEASKFSIYSEEIVEKVRKFWKLPKSLLESELKCRVRIYLSRSGQLLNMKIFQASGNSDYDMRAQNSIKDASPFSSPPKIIQEKIRRGEVVLGFPL